MGEVSLGTVYEMNKNLMKNEKKLSKPALENKIKKVQSFFKENKFYFMLLCHERRDYTIIKLKNKDSYEKAGEELKECLLNRGDILAIDKENENTFEIWLKIDDEAFCYYLFPYDDAIVEV